MEEALRAKLRTTAALTAIVDQRIDWGVRPSGSPLPAVTLEQITGAPQMNLAGPSGWTRGRVQIDCWARTFKAARDARDVIVATLNGYRDNGAIKLRTIVLDTRGGRPGTNADDQDDQGPVFRSSLDLLVWHTS